jgi:hypothetical protein
VRTRKVTFAVNDKSKFNLGQVSDALAEKDPKFETVELLSGP